MPRFFYMVTSLFHPLILIPMIMASPKAFARQGYQESYVRRRENPIYKGLLPRDDKAVTFDFPPNETSQMLSRSISDIGDIGQEKFVPSTSVKFKDLPFEDIASSDVNSETLEQYFSVEKSSKVAKPNTFAFSTTTMSNISNYSLGDSLGLTYESGAPTTKPDEDQRDNSLALPRPTMEKTFVVNKRKADMSSVSLPQSAASYYNPWPQIEVVELCESIKRLNTYLKEQKAEVNAGVPGRFLYAVIGQDVSDVGSVASTIMYAFYLNETQSTDQFCTVPVINMKRADVSAHAELKWLLDSCQIDQTSLIFIDEVDLSYYNLFGGLKLAVLNDHKLPAKQEALKEAVVEILTCRSKGESAYPWVEIVTETEDCTSCTIIAEKFALTAPEFLVGKGFSRLLLAGILLDSENLSNPHCSLKDKYMATLLIHGAGKLGCSGLFQMLGYKKHDISDLKVADILRKDFKRWTRSLGKPDGTGSRSMVTYIGMSSIGLSLSQLLAHESAAAQQIKYFQQLEKLRLLMIVSGYNDSKNNFKREILVSAESPEHMKSLLFFFNSNSTHLPLKAMNLQGLPEEMRAFEIDKVTSRKTIERLLEEFGGTSKG